jgi:hypothetical protein
MTQMSEHESLSAVRTLRCDPTIRLKSPGSDRPRRPDRIPLTEPVRPPQDDDGGDGGRQDEAELPGEGGTYDND